MIDILAKKIEKARGRSRYKIPERSPAYIVDLVEEKYKRIRGFWKRGQPQHVDPDVLETPQQVEARLVESKAYRLTKARTRERRIHVS